jgi:hypothetical protein
VQFRLVEKQPSAGSAPPAIERIAKVRSEHGRDARVTKSRPRCRVQLAVENFGDEVVGNPQQVVV